MREPNQDFDSKRENKQAHSPSNPVFEPDDESMNLNDVWSSSELSLHMHENAASPTKTAEQQEVVEYDQSTRSRNLTNNEEPKDTTNYSDLNFRTELIETVSDMGGIDEQETSSNSRFSNISLTSDHIDHGPLIGKVSNGMIIESSFFAIISLLVTYL
jgi:hypothetical protein